MIYGVLIALIYLSKFIYDRIPALTEKRRKMLFLGTAFALLFFVCAFRHVSVGTDMQSYLNKYVLLSRYSFLDIFSGFYSERVEIGFALLNKLLSLISPFPQTIIIVSTFLFCLGCATFIYRYIDNDLTAVILFTCGGMYMYAFNITRQMIACAILMNAWGLLTEKRYRASFLLFALSITFHVTSAVFILAYLFYFIRHNKTAVTITATIGLLLALNYIHIINFAAQFTDKFSYLDNSRQKIDASGVWAIWSVEIAVLATYLLYYYFRHTSTATRLLNKLPHPVSGISAVESLCIPVFVALYIIFICMGTQFNYMDRFGVYFLPFCMLLFINFGNRIKEQSIRLARIYTAAVHTCSVIYFVFFASALPHYSYMFMWS